MALLLSLVVVAYNNLINRWKPFHGAAYVPANLAFATTMASAAAAAYRLSPSELGLRAELRGAAVVLLSIALFALGAFVLARSRYAHRIVDARVADLRGRALAYYVLLRIPLGTAVAEELVFRGALFAAWREAGASTGAAAMATSVAFGLWHIAPTIIGVRMNEPTASVAKLATLVVAGVVLTTIAGLALTWLRLRTGGLIAPIVVHAGLNSFSALASVLASRHPRPASGRT